MNQPHLRKARRETLTSCRHTECWQNKLQSRHHRTHTSDNYMHRAGVARPELGSNRGPHDVSVYVSYLLSHCMQPEGLWQRLTAALSDSAPIFPPLERTPNPVHDVAVCARSCRPGECTMTPVPLRDRDETVRGQPRIPRMAWPPSLK